MGDSAASIYELELPLLTGGVLPLASFAERVVLIVNVASRCGLTPQYEALQRLHERYGARGLSVIGVPCNQFGGQEPGLPEEIAAFCEGNYRVGFPLTAKIDVNGVHRHPLYRLLTDSPDTDGEAGDVRWNFEKFLVSRGGDVVRRFPPQVDPESPDVVAAIEELLPS